MSEKIFTEALNSMVAGFAYVGAVRHLYDIGYSVAEIQKNLDYPVSIEKIEKVITDYEREKNSPESRYEYVQKTDEFGRRSFIRVTKEK